MTTKDISISVDKDTKAYFYGRLSGRGQIGNDGIPRQRSAVEDYARAHGYEIAGEYLDEGISGTKDLIDRPALTALFAAISTQFVRVVLVETSSRLARDLMIGEILLSEFRKLGVQVIAVDCDTDLTVDDGDVTKVLIRQVLGAISQWEKSILVEKLRGARARIRKSGKRCEGRKPYGSLDGEQAIIERMSYLRSSGESLASIASVLNSEGHRPRQAAQWQPMTIQRILTRYLQPQTICGENGLQVNLVKQS